MKCLLTKMFAPFNCENHQVGSKERKSMKNQRVLTSEGEEWRCPRSGCLRTSRQFSWGLTMSAYHWLPPRCCGARRGRCPRMSSLENSSEPLPHGSLPLHVCLFLFKFSSFLPSFIFGCTGSSLLFSLSLVVESEDCSSLQCTGFSLQWLLWLRSPGSRHTSFSTWASSVHGSVKPGTTVGLQPSRLPPP